jgi:hypothetical protein
MTVKAAKNNHWLMQHNSITFEKIYQLNRYKLKSPVIVIFRLILSVYSESRLMLSLVNVISRLM